MDSYSEIGDKPVRTIPQNSAIHKYFTMLADSLNNAGKDVLTVLDSEIEIEWTSGLIELFKDELAVILNNSGLTFRCLLGKGDRAPWTGIKVKALIWKKVQKMQFDIDSTTKLDTRQVSYIYELINRHTSATFGVSVAFPEKDRFLK